MVTWPAAGSTSSSTRGYALARSVVTSAGAVAPASARVKNRRAAVLSRFGREQHVDDLAELVDCPVQVTPPAEDLHICLVNEPAVPRIVPGGLGRLDEQRGEPPDPPVHRHVVHLDAAFGEQLLDVAVGQPEPEVPADSQRDDFRREAEPGELRTWGGDPTC